MEAGVFIDVLGWARHDFKYDITLETCGFAKQVVSTFGVPIVVDKLIDEVRAEDYDAIAIPGGFAAFGFYEEAYDERFLQLVRTFDEKGKIIASVCVASMALGKSGILEGRNGTTYHLEGGRWQRQLAGFGVNVINERIVIDRNVITSYCPETAAWVAFELLEMLTSKEETDVVKEAMGYAAGS